MTELHYRSATSLAGSIRDGEIGARELLEHFLDRVDRHNPAINAIVVQRREEARARADAADAARARGAALGPLHGLPMTMKESYQWTGTPGTWGAPELRDNIAQIDAIAVQRLNTGGANFFGKTNVPLRLADFQSFNEVYGTTNNPWDVSRTPGGSSGGSAAALAAGLTGLEIGSDIGGSLRNPAHFCGVFTHKPTWGLVPPRGHSPAAGSVSPVDISVIGPLARSAADLRLAMSLMAGPDVLDAQGITVNLPGLDKPLSQLRVAVWASDPHCPPSKAVVGAVNRVAKAFEAEGAAVDADARPGFSTDESDFVFSALLMANMASRMAQPAFDDLVERTQALKPDDQSPAAWQLRRQTMRFHEWSGLNERRNKLRFAWHEFFQNFDVVIAPIMPTTAFPHDHRPEAQRSAQVDGETLPYFSQTFWAGLSGVSHLPSTAIPTGPAADGLPIGVQLIGPAYSDLKLIDLASRLEEIGFGFQPPSGYDP
jgi:amidase